MLPPEHFDRSSEKELLGFALGATLYTPGTRDIARALLSDSLPGLTSLVLCLEDAIEDDAVPVAEANTIDQLSRIAEAESAEPSAPETPLLFIRVRSPMQFEEFADRLEAVQASVLTGFVFPKFTSESGGAYFGVLERLNRRLGTSLYAMPILEGRRIAHRETRAGELLDLHRLLGMNRAAVLNIRIGGTDLSSLFGLRRDVRASIYDLLTVQDVLADILNTFGRPNDGYVISGPVWEHFLAYKRDDLTELLQRDEAWHMGPRTRPILNEAVDGLIREAMLDKVNGLIGKTVIHPSHVRLVNALQGVTREEYEDASQILSSGGGAMRSPARNKMNEVNPHRNWATRVTMLARVYGVVEHQRDLLSLAL